MNYNSENMQRKLGGLIWLYGIHTCRMVLENPQRKINSILITREDLLPKLCLTETLRKHYELKITIVNRQQIENLLPPQSVHQGVAIQVAPLESIDIIDLQNNSVPNQCVVVLDQISDPHNVGAILRSAAVFGASAVILTDRNAPLESGILAKSASGGLDVVPLIRVTNLAHALKDLKDIGFWCVGFAETGNDSLNKIDLRGKIALIMGAEGSGMRRLTKDLCDFMVCLPSVSNFSTLNVSNAAAIALYETYRLQHS